MRKEKIKKYTTSDLGSSACLLCLNHTLLSITKIGNKASFEFQDSPLLRTDLNKYWENKIKVDPRTYFDNLKMLKNRIYNS